MKSTFLSLVCWAAEPGTEKKALFVASQDDGMQFFDEDGGSTLSGTHLISAAGTDELIDETWA